MSDLQVWRRAHSAGCSAHECFRHYSSSCIGFVLFCAWAFLFGCACHEASDSSLIRAVQRGDEMRVAQLLSAGFPAHDPGEPSKSLALEIAAGVYYRHYRENAKIVELLLQHGAPLPPPDSGMFTMLAANSDIESQRILLTFLQHGVSPNSARPDRFMIHSASLSAPINVLVLIGAGASVNVLDDEGRSPMHCIARGPRRPFDHLAAQSLVRHGADVLHRDNNGLIPLDIARRDRTPQDPLLAFLQKLMAENYSADH